MTILDKNTKLLTTLLKYVSTIVVKDEILAEQVETYKSQQNADVMLNYFYDEFYDENLTMKENLNNFESHPVYQNYKEMNEYISYIKEILELHSVNMSYIEIRKSEPFEVLYYDSSLVSLQLHQQFTKELVAEYEYQKLNFLPEAYKDSDLFTSMFRFSLMISTILRVLKLRAEERITISTEDIKLLDNFILSYGFVLNGLLSDSVKARFAVSLHKLFRTKGSFTNLAEISNIFNFSDTSIFNLYLIFDEKRWIANNSPADKTGYYYFLAVNEMKGETFPKVFNDELLRTERIKDYDFITDLDNSWMTTENELFDNGISFVKSKYFFVADERTIQTMTDAMSLMSNIAKRLKITGRINDFKYSIEPLNDTDLYTIIKYHVFMTNKVIDKEFDYLMSTADQDRQSVFTGFSSKEEFYNFVDNIVDKKDLVIKFEEKLDEINLKRDALQFNRLVEKGKVRGDDGFTTWQDLFKNFADLPISVTQSSFNYLLSGINAYDSIKDSRLDSNIREQYEESVSMNSQLLTNFGTINLDNKGSFYQTIEYFRTFYSKMLFEDNSYRFKEFLMARKGADKVREIVGTNFFNEKNTLGYSGFFTDILEQQITKFTNNPNDVDFYTYYRQFYLEKLSGVGIVTDAGVTRTIGKNIKDDELLNPDGVKNIGTNTINRDFLIKYKNDGNYDIVYSNDSNEFQTFFIGKEGMTFDDSISIERIII